MEQWEKFELDCVTYLKDNYENDGIMFKHQGGSDSTVPDIAVLKNNNLKFYIETKMSNAQSGQFVVLPHDDKEMFYFSPKNKTQPNELTQLIIEHMNKNFHKFHGAGTAGEKLNIPDNIFSEWIINYYSQKRVKYIMTQTNNNFIIFPLERFNEYFKVSAKYRIKKSGSAHPAKKDMPTLINILKERYSVTETQIDGKKLIVQGDDSLNKIKFPYGKYTYYLSPKSPNSFEVKKLSNTYNMNVIFSISLKQKQLPNDLITFINDL